MIFLLFHLLLFQSIIFIIKKDNFGLFSSFAIAYGSQIVMLIVPTMGYRTTLVTYVFLIVYFIVAISELLIKKNFRIKYFSILVLLIIFVFAFHNYKTLFCNYKKNSDILKYNDYILLEEKKQNFVDCEYIELYKVPF